MLCNLGLSSGLQAEIVRFFRFRDIAKQTPYNTLIINELQ